MKAMIILGNGGADMSELWYPYAKEYLAHIGLEVIAENIPDPEHSYVLDPEAKLHKWAEVFFT